MRLWTAGLLLASDAIGKQSSRGSGQIRHRNFDRLGLFQEGSPEPLSKLSDWKLLPFVEKSKATRSSGIPIFLSE